jgi:Histidine kinase-, DNA gyrase B-, and HSP90-like ATPase
VPRADSSRSFDHRVCTQQDCFGDGDPEGFGNLEVHDQLEPRWALDGEVGRLGAAQNPTDVNAATTKHIRKVRPIGDETTRVHVRPVKVHRGQASLLREIADLRSVSEAERIRQNDESVGAPDLRRVESAAQVRGVLHVHCANLHCERPSYPLQLSNLGCIDVGLTKDGNARRPGYDLLKNLQVLAAQLEKVGKQSSNVAARPCDARHKPGLNGIDFEINPHDWDVRGRVLSGCQSPGATGEDHINFEACKFKCKFRKKFGLVVRGSVLKCDVLSLHVSEIMIRDNGGGIPPEVREKMFNPFFTTKPPGEGTGLGLSLSYDIVVKQHGGSIEVDTQPGEFTEFRVILPRMAATGKAGADR